MKLLGATAVLGSFGAPQIVWGDEDDFAEFMKLSFFLTGRPALDERLGRRIFMSLTSLDKAFAVNMKALAKYIADGALAAESLQAKLDSDNKNLADLPRRILGGWYLGVVGTGKNAVAVAYEDAMMFTPVSDVVVIPSFAKGPYGYWGTAPKL